MSVSASSSPVPQWAKWILPIVIIAVAYLLVQWMKMAKPSVARSAVKRIIPVVEVAEVNLQTLQLKIESQGVVQPKRQINLVSEVAGAVVWVSPKLVDGGRVSKGELLLKVDPINYQVAVAEAQSAVAQAQLNLADEQAENKRGAAYASQNNVSVGSMRQHKLAVVEAELVASKARFKQAEHQLANTQIVAPFDALVASKDVDVGQYISVGNTLFGLLGTAVAEVLLPINASELQYLSNDSVGVAVNLRSSTGYGEQQQRQQWQARLARVEGFVDSETRVVKAVAQFKEPYDSVAKPLSIGMFVEAEIDGMQVQSAVRIPSGALHGNRVYIADEGQLRAKTVDVFRQEKQHVVINGGLENGDLLVTTRLDLMIEGMAIESQINQSPVLASQSVEGGE